jgi:chromosome segregation ATPase
MPDTRKPSRPSRDPRLDSRPPAAPSEVPLGSPHAPTGLAPERVASLQAEVVRLRAERETDVDETAEMFVQLVESDRMRVAAQSEAMVAGERVGALQSDLDEAHQRVDALEAEVAGLRQQWSLAESRLDRARLTIAAALSLLEDMERREEMAASLRARAVRDALQTLAHGRESEPTDTRGEISSGPESSVEVVGTHDMDWDLDIAGSE